MAQQIKHLVVVGSKILYLVLMILGGAGATLATVLLSATSSYCTVSSVAAPSCGPARLPLYF